ncbi:hypothetical protein O6H91_06G073800 [Diphasiastrum complanatum]|uniref:Uncharacterized protein n=1 Tax=Diphasiastrum complanatum TaxID=34168 RepID=A0ACC2DFJ1_DIPCM|nr:hypothetical protein O6H91_Y311700 [Diphasiastrum complanatum]KAJ7552875.1 hypothetical protein O6H91_06G073800 [Diphasiastrum complanatum]
MLLPLPCPSIHLKTLQPAHLSSSSWPPTCPFLCQFSSSAAAGAALSFAASKGEYHYMQRCSKKYYTLQSLCSLYSLNSFVDDDEVELVRKGAVDTQEALRTVDKELRGGNDRKALDIVNALRSRGGLRGFGLPLRDQIPKRIYYLDELRLNNIEPSRLLSPVDVTLGAVRSNLQLAALFGGILSWQTRVFDQVQLLIATIVFLLFGTLDQIATGGGIEALVLDTLGRLLSAKYKKRVAHHEAGHFLIAYLLGILPKNYALSSLDAFRKDGSLNVQAGTTFVDFAFEEEVKSGKLSSESLDKYTCIALAGVATEYVAYGVAEGGLADIQQLDNLLKGLNFSQLKADSQLRWAVLNVVTLLRRHQKELSELAVAMDSGKSIGDCISTIEENLAR